MYTAAKQARKAQVVMPMSTRVPITLATVLPAPPRRFFLLRAGRSGRSVLPTLFSSNRSTSFFWSRCLFQCHSWLPYLSFRPRPLDLGMAGDPAHAMRNF